MRKCHLNTCPVGIATQDKTLRKRFNGEVDHMVNLIHFLTEELREIMASLGVRKVDDLIGNTKLLKQRNNQHWKTKNLDLNPILFSQLDKPKNYYNSTHQKDFLSDQLDYVLLEKIKDTLDNPSVRSNVSTQIKSTDRAVGTIISSEISRKFGSEAISEDSININFIGSAGQSFGAFGSKGLTLKIEGDSNDYFGKGLSGAKLIIRPPKESRFVPNENMIIGNVALYGATSGSCFINGKAGERFCVRNSGVDVVVEGVGDNACEYMTGGVALILGNIGKNFGAGMSGGIAYIYGNKNLNNFNKSSIDLVNTNEEDIKKIKALLHSHRKYTDSHLASFILDDIQNQKNNFTKVYPKELRRIHEKNKIHANG